MKKNKDITFKVSKANYFTVSPDHCVWGQRKIPDYEFIYQVSGTSVYTQDDSDIVLLHHEILLIPPDVTHTFAVSKQHPSSISCIHFTPSANLSGVCPLRLPAGHDFEILMLFKRIAGEYTQYGTARSEILGTMLKEAYLRLQSKPRIIEKILPARLKTAISYINDRYSGHITRSSAARYCNTNPEYLSTLFSRYMGFSLNTFLVNLRIEKAKQLLSEKGFTVRESAIKSGFQDPLYFSKIFKKKTGMTPGQYRSML